jgi:hypothetical protein
VAHAQLREDLKIHNWLLRGEQLAWLVYLVIFSIGSFFIFPFYFSTEVYLISTSGFILIQTLLFFFSFHSIKWVINQIREIKETFIFFQPMFHGSEL